MATQTAQDLTDTGYWEMLIKKSVSRFFMLSMLADRPMYGYEIAQEIETCCAGWCKPTAGMIYPTIKELEAEGYVSCKDSIEGGRRRKVCQLTEKGHEAYQAGARVWSDVLPYLGQTVENALHGTGACNCEC